MCGKFEKYTIFRFCKDYRKWFKLVVRLCCFSGNVLFFFEYKNSLSVEQANIISGSWYNEIECVDRCDRFMNVRKYQDMQNNIHNLPSRKVVDMRPAVAQMI